MMLMLILRVFCLRNLFLSMEWNWPSPTPFLLMAASTRQTLEMKLSSVWMWKLATSLALWRQMMENLLLWKNVKMDTFLKSLMFMHFLKKRENWMEIMQKFQTAIPLILLTEMILWPILSCFIIPLSLLQQHQMLQISQTKLLLRPMRDMPTVRFQLEFRNSALSRQLSLRMIQALQLFWMLLEIWKVL